MDWKSTRIWGKTIEIAKIGFSDFAWKVGWNTLDQKSGAFRRCHWSQIQPLLKDPRTVQPLAVCDCGEWVVNISEAYSDLKQMQAQRCSHSLPSVQLHGLIRNMPGTPTPLHTRQNMNNNLTKYGPKKKQGKSTVFGHISEDHFSTRNPQVCWFYFVSLVRKEKSLLRKPGSPY